MTLLSFSASCSPPTPATEHLGLIEPQWCTAESRPTKFMRAAPTPNPDETHEREDELVADPISEETMNLWNGTARKNRAIFQEVFRPVPTNLIRSWKEYDGYVPNVMTGHVVPDVPLERVKQRLSEVRGALVECPMVRAAPFVLGVRALVADVCDWCAGLLD